MTRISKRDLRFHSLERAYLTAMEQPIPSHDPYVHYPETIDQHYARHRHALYAKTLSGRAGAEIVKHARGAVSERKEGPATRTDADDRAEWMNRLREARETEATALSASKRSDDDDPWIDYVRLPHDDEAGKAAIESIVSMMERVRRREADALTNGLDLGKGRDDAWYFESVRDDCLQIATTFEAFVRARISNVSWHDYLVTTSSRLGEMLNSMTWSRGFLVRPRLSASVSSIRIPVPLTKRQQACDRESRIAVVRHLAIAMRVLYGDDEMARILSNNGIANTFDRRPMSDDERAYEAWVLRSVADFASLRRKLDACADAVEKTRRQLDVYPINEHPSQHLELQSLIAGACRRAKELHEEWVDLNIETSMVLLGGFDDPNFEFWIRPDNIDKMFNFESPRGGERYLKRAEIEAVCERWLDESYGRPMRLSWRRGEHGSCMFREIVAWHVHYAERIEGRRGIEGHA